MFGSVGNGLRAVPPRVAGAEPWRCPGWLRERNATVVITLEPDAPFYGAGRLRRHHHAERDVYGG